MSNNRGLTTELGYIPWAEDLVPDPKTMEDIKKKLEEIGKYFHKEDKNMKKKSIYFAHPFDKIGSKREEMIIKTLEERGYEVVNPFERESKLNEKYGVNHYYESPTKSFAKDIVRLDKEAVKECDEYFGWFPKGVTMIGTPIELVWAYDFGKKITVICYKPQPFLWCLADTFYIGYENFVKDIKFV